MAEYIRGIEVRIMVDTNKRTEQQRYYPSEGEDLADLLRRLANAIDDAGGVLHGGLP